MKTIFEKNCDIDGVTFTGENTEAEFLDEKYRRIGNVGLPSLSELEVLRHYKELSDRNFCIEKGFYPLGSCTMKYNPKVNEFLASLDGFANPVSYTHLNPEKAVQEIKKHLKKSEIREIELDLSSMNILDAVKVLVLTSSYLYKKSPEEKLKFRFVSSDIENILSSFSLTNLEMV